MRPAIVVEQPERLNATVEEQLRSARISGARQHPFADIATWIVRVVQAHPGKDAKWIGRRYGIPIYVVEHVQERERQ